MSVGQGVAEAIAEEAIRDFGGQGDLVFNTATVQQAIKKITGQLPDSAPIVEFLEGCMRIVRLHGGCHWMLLPHGHRKFRGPSS
jgi:hypothetical protein